MKLHEILLELTYEQVPSTDWGYWIDAEGKFIPVDTMQHLNVAKKYFKLKPAEQREMYVQIFNEGWIRVMFSRLDPGEFGAQMTTSVSTKAKQNVIYFLKLFRKQIEMAFVDVVDIPNARGNFEPPNATGKAINFINQHT